MQAAISRMEDESIGGRPPRATHFVGGAPNFVDVAEDNLVDGPGNVLRCPMDGITVGSGESSAHQRDVYAMGQLSTHLWYCLAMKPSNRGEVVLSNVSLCSPGLKNVVSNWLSTYFAVVLVVLLAAAAAGDSMPMRKIWQSCMRVTCRRTINWRRGSATHHVNLVPCGIRLPAINICPEIPQRCKEASSA